MCTKGDTTQIQIADPKAGPTQSYSTKSHFILENIKGNVLLHSKVLCTHAVGTLQNKHFMLWPIRYVR